MRRCVVKLLALLVLMLPAVAARAQDPKPAPPAPAPAPLPPKPCPCDNCKECSIEAPETVDVWVGRQFALAVKCGKGVTVVPPDKDDDITVVPSFAANTFTVTAYAEGTYTIVVAVASAGEVKYAKVKVVATKKPAKPDVKPVPPAPGPGPGPGPAPEPKPVDPLTKELQNAYGLDTSAGKAEQVQALAALYKSAIDKVADAETGAKLLADLKAVAAAMKIPDDALPLVRSRVAVELKKVLVAGTLSADQKDQVKKLFAKLADGLSACK
jgi:hypothetical protein